MRKMAVKVQMELAPSETSASWIKQLLERLVQEQQVLWSI